MNRTQFISFLILAVLISCRKITNQDLVGHWAIPRFENGELYYSELEFTENEISLIGDFLFKETGPFELIDGELIIRLSDDNVIKTKIEKLVVDTLVIFEGATYFRDKYSIFSDIEEYELIGIETNNQLDLDKFYLSIHYYKSEGNSVKMRCDAKLAHFDDIPLYLGNYHSNPELIVFIGKGINLKDLKKLYYHFEISGCRKVTLVLCKQGVSNYNILQEKIEIWRRDLDEYVNNFKLRPAPLPPPEYASKEEYLKNGGEEIKITSRLDFEKLNSLNEEKRYVLSIDEELNFKDYVDLKMKVGELRRSKKLEIKTEIK